MKELWSEARVVFEHALELSPDERTAYVDRACGENAELRVEVEELLASDSDAASFLEPMDLRRLPEALAQQLGEELTGQRVGDYQLRRVLARGGMGTVYEAEQDEPRRVVALKMLRSGLPSDGEVRRFRFESEVLARLRHPGIAQVFQAGTHVLDEESDGRELPWFAMEYVENARSILTYAREKRLDLEERIKLFMQICEAVHHAHQNGVIHRDLKPTNILVDESGRPKIIDFGIARAVAATGAEGATLQTEVNHILGTLRYMSPEQIGGNVDEIDTRSDVYALGVVFYELLCAAPPYQLEGASIVDAARTIQEDSPLRPSAVDAAVAHDLDWIVMKALEKERERRYASASELAADLERFLAHEPVLAGPPSAAYRLRKLVRRHRTLAVSAAAVVVAFVLGIVGLGTGLVRAQDEADKAVAIREFFEELLVAPSPFEQGRSVPMTDVLRRASKELGATFADEPEVKAALHFVIGRAFFELGELDEAEPHLEAALSLRRITLGVDDRETLEAMEWLGTLYWEQGRLAEAEELFTETLELARFRGLEEDDLRFVIKLLNDLYIVLFDQDRLDEAYPLLDEAFERAQEHLESDDSLMLTLMNNTARAMESRGEIEQAEERYREVVEARTAALGPDHPKTLVAIDNLGWILHEQRECEEAEEVMRIALDGFRVTSGEEHQDTGRCLTMLGRCVMVQGRLVEAEELFRKSHAILKGDPGPANLHTINARYRIALCVYRQGRPEEAEEEALGALKDSELELPPGHHLRQYAFGLIADCMRDQGRVEEAELQLQVGLEEMTAANGSDHGSVGDLRTRLTALREGQGQ